MLKSEFTVINLTFDFIKILFQFKYLISSEFVIIVHLSIKSYISIVVLGVLIKNKKSSIILLYFNICSDCC